VKPLFLIILLSTLPPVAFSDDFTEHALGVEFLKEGLHHYNRQEYEASIDFFRKSLGKLSADDEELLGLSYEQQVRYLLGMAYYRAGFEESAIFEFDTLIDNTNDEIFRGIFSQFVAYLNMKRFVAREVRKSNNYSLSLEIEGNPIGKYKLSRVTGMETDDLGNIYAAGFGSKLTLKISPDGSPLFDFSHPRITPGRFYDVKRDSQGNIYISDFSSDTIYRFREDGRVPEVMKIRYIGRIGESGFGDGQFYGPTALEVDRDDNLYVIDSGNMRVVKFSPSGNFLLSFGREGDDDGEFDHPSGIAVDHAGNIYISDHGKKKIGMYDKSGNFITYLKGIELIDPFGISFAENNRLIVSDGPTIKSYDTLHSTWTDIDTGGVIQRALDAHIDHLGQLVVSDYKNDRILQFVPREDKYRNLNVILNRIDTGSFTKSKPVIAYYVSVFDADGLPIYGLSEKNFLLRLGGVVVPKTDLRHMEERDSRLNVVFLVDKSLAMGTYAEDIRDYMESFLNNMGQEDEMMVIGFNDMSWIASSFTNSRLRTMDAILEDRYEQVDARVFDKAFRRSIDELNRKFHKKVLVIVTDGRLDAGSFNTYSYQSCIDYAANNHIPVYVLNFGQGEGQYDLSNLEFLARSSGGAYYNVYQSNAFPYLYQTMQAHRSPEYFILFEDNYDPALRNKYMEAEVEVDYNGRVGRSILGFVYPSP
jgi:DNA-binding beta-propeller fold protein YncE/Mg-chelatase subunit ChlD